jgi:hypothetical protein
MANRSDKVVITEPCESPSKMTRPHLQWDRSELWRMHGKRGRQEGGLEIRRGSKMINQCSQKSISSRPKTTRKFHIRFSKRTNAAENDPEPLVPLGVEPEEHDETIGQLRAKKIKL